MRADAATRTPSASNLGAAATNDVEVPVEWPMNERIARTDTPAPLVSGFDVASREHDGDISARVAVPAFDGTR